MLTAAAFMRAAERLPLARAAGEIVGSAGALILAPHPDDESLGCGGLIAALVAERLPVRIAVMSDGAGSHPQSQRYPAEALRRLRRDEACDAVAILKAGIPRFLDWPDGAVPAAGARFDEAVDQVARLADGVGTIVAPSALDPHIDHEATAAIARAVAGRLGLRLLAYPIWSWRYLYPRMLPIGSAEVSAPPRGRRLDIAEHLALKRHAVMAHRSQTTRLIDDDPDGFLLTPRMLAVLLRPFEVYLDDMP